MKNMSHTIQLINGDGAFSSDFSGFVNDLRRANFGKDGHSYRVVSIIGPQGSGVLVHVYYGKSTLLNQLFQTSFEENNATAKTTRGIWLAACPSSDVDIIVMDVKGTDGQEREKDDTAFEKLSARFALVASHIIIINMWCVGRDLAASMCLMMTVFQVMMQLYKPHKRRLIFVMRDKTKTPFESLKKDLLANIKQIWDSVDKPQHSRGSQLDHFFTMEFVALTNSKEEKFKSEVKFLKNKLSLFALEGLAVPITGFARSVKEKWEAIKASKDLNRPKHESLEVLSVLAAIRLDDQPDNIKNTLSRVLKVDGGSIFTSGSSTSSIDMLASSTCEGVAAADVLITPKQCKLSWEQFEEAIQPLFRQACVVQENDKESKALKAAVAKKAEEVEAAEARAEAAEMKLKESKDKLRSLLEIARGVASIATITVGASV